MLVSCISACGRCRFCKEATTGSAPGGGGWIFGHLIDGLQAELARVPFADTSVYKIPDALTDEQVLFLADILPTSFEVGVLNGRSAGRHGRDRRRAGPIGLAAIMTAKLYTPGKIVAIDLADARLAKALDFGADVVINNGSEDPSPEGHGPDGRPRRRRRDRGGRRPRDVRACTELVRPGGRIANVGVHGHPATFHLEKLWIRDILVTTGLVDTFSTPKLLKLIADGRLDPTPFATHRFELGETESRTRRSPTRRRRTRSRSC